MIERVNEHLERKSQNKFFNFWPEYYFAFLFPFGNSPAMDDLIENENWVEIKKKYERQGY